MSKWQRFRQVVFGGGRFAVLLYVIVFAVLLVPTVRGVGQYWDWTFPYYTDQIGNFFGRASQAWTEIAGGSPLGYSSDYFVRFAVSLFGWIRPEWLLYLLLLGLFVGGGYGVYIIARHYTRAWIAFLLGVAAFVNPTIFYKFTAGHINYLISYVLLIYMVHFLLHRFRPDWRSAVVVGLMLGLIGAQIQFLAVAAGLIALYFVFRPDVWRWKFLVPLLALPVLVNAVWLSNFVFGGADIASVSNEATRGSFVASSNSNYLNIFGFSFSKATLISRFYSVYELLLYGLLFVLMVAVLLKSGRKQAEDVWLLTFLLVVLFLATGLFQMLNLGPLTTLYPMFREVGHFAPVIVLVMILLLGRLMPRGVMKGVIIGWLVIVIGLSFLRYQLNTQSIDFAASRDKFAEFKQFDQTHRDPNSRVLAYPFFGQYSFIDFPQQFQANLPMRNSGHDGFSSYSHNQFIKNAVKPQDFKTSMQYRLLSTLDVDVLRPYNVRYIYDFSHIYVSNYDRYVPPSTYDGNLGWIKNNPHFMEQLLAANPGQLRRVSDHILEVIDSAPRVTVTDGLYSVDSKDDGELARPFMAHAFPDQAYDYVDTSAFKAPTHTGMVKPLLVRPQPDLIDMEGKSLTQTISVDRNLVNKLYASSVPSTVGYQAANGVVTFFAVSTGKLYVNGRLVQDGQAAQPLVISQIKMAADKEYFIGLGSTVKPIKRNGTEVIGRLSDVTMLELFAATSDNLVSNSSFEPGLWATAVGDCNDYDDQPDIGMKQSTEMASMGRKSLELSAKRHDACTSTGFELKGGALYLLTYDYQSPNADTASFYMRFNNSDDGALKRFQSITDDKWHSASYPFVTDEGTTNGQLFLHAQAGNGSQTVINRYDNVSLTELTKVGEFPVPAAERRYEIQDLSQDTATFHYVDPTYSYENVVANGSFEQGLWRERVLDCNSYDKSPKIGMSLDKNTKSHGGQSLQLEVSRHAACTYTSVNIQPGTDYLLSFDYQVEGAGQIGYYAEFDGVDVGSQDRIAPKSNGWHTYSTKIRAPSATSMRLFLHAYESNGSAKNVVHFDNIKLIAIPSVEQQFYAVGQPQQALAKPERLEFRTDSETRRSIWVRGAREPFTVLLGESYHPGWRLELRDAQAESWQPGARVVVAGEHFKASGYSNAWRVDPAQLCGEDKQGCHRRTDGSYDIEMIAEFVPQRWFDINRAVSIGTLLVAGGYIVATHRRAKRRLESEGVYKHQIVRRQGK